ncbi:unnamed protein product [Phytomonas sp. Hart1]|nr:unnamed protein product [Phytomonas sp. Hart1]|eukprot:CCW67328.1 unnamed protein product [Phytomonas sp. isolate Hart1]
MVFFLFLYRREFVYLPNYRRFPMLRLPPLFMRQAAFYTSCAHTTTSSARIIRSSHNNKQSTVSQECLSFSPANTIEEIVEKGASTTYHLKFHPDEISDRPNLGLDIDKDRSLSTGFDGRFSTASGTECNDRDKAIMDFNKAKVRLSYYASIIGNRPLKSSHSTVPSISEDELAEVRNILDCIIQSDHQFKNYCILDSFRVAYHFGFPKRCCELYTSVARDALGGGGNGENRLPFPEAVLISEIVLEAAAATMDLETLSLCTGIVEKMASIASTSVQKPLEVPAPAVVSALRLYWYLVLLLRDHQFAPKLSSSTGLTEEAAAHDISMSTKVEKSQRFHASFTTLATRVVNILGVVEANRNAFIVASVRLAFYNKNVVDGQAAVYHQVFRHWCLQHSDAPKSQERHDHDDGTPNKEGYSVPSWFTAHCLHEFMRSVIYTRRHDIAEVYSLHVDLFWRRRRRSPLAPHHTEKPLDYDEDALVGSMVRYFAFSRQTRRGVLWVQSLMSQFPGYVPSIPVCNGIARLAAAERDISLSKWCLSHLLSETQPVPPTSTELYACLCANARVGIPNFDQVLHSLQENQLVQLTEEELLHLRLLHCRASTQWQNISTIVRQAAPSVASINDGNIGAALTLSSTGVFTAEDDYRSFGIARILDGRFEYLETNPRSVFSIRNLDQLLLVMQESEHSHFLAYYRFFLSRYMNLLSLEKRAQWAGLALVWALTRVGKMSKEDILYIAWEVAQLLQLQRTGDPKVDRTPNETLDVILPGTEKSLRRRWGMICIHFPQAWWKQLFSKKIKQQKHQLLRNSGWNGGTSKRGVDTVLIDETTLKSIIHAYESSTLPSARFLKYHTRGLCTDLTSTRLFDDVTLAIFREETPWNMMERNACYLLASKREWWRLQSN